MYRYKIKSYERILKNPKDTYRVWSWLDNRLAIEKRPVGANGAVLMDQQKESIKLILSNKIVPTVLAKISNFIPEQVLV